MKNKRLMLTTKNNIFLFIILPFMVNFSSFYSSGISIVLTNNSSKNIFFTPRFQYLITSLIPVLQLWHGVITIFAPVALICSAFTLFPLALCAAQLEIAASPPPPLQQKLCSRFGCISVKSSHVALTMYLNLSAAPALLIMLQGSCKVTGSLIFFALSIFILPSLISS